MMENLTARLEAVGRRITLELDKIRIRVGAEKAPPFDTIDETIEGGGGVVEVVIPPGVIAFARKPVFLYIRDHTRLMSTSNESAWERKRIHFTYCQALIDKERNGQLNQYRVTNRVDNRYSIDYRDGVREMLLYPCGFCLDKSRYLCYKYDDMSPEQRGRIVKSFDARTALELVGRYIEEFQTWLDSKEMRGAGSKTGYPENWGDLSDLYRRSKNYICERCGVDLSSHRRLCDTHHVNSDKRDSRSGNLQCLCKLCHGEIHSHYTIASDDRRLVESIRRGQGVRGG